MREPEWAITASHACDTTIGASGFGYGRSVRSGITKIQCSFSILFGDVPITMDPSVDAALIAASSASSS